MSADAAKAARNKTVKKLFAQCAYGKLVVTTTEALKLALKLGFVPSYGSEEVTAELVSSEGLMRQPNNLKYRDQYRTEHNARVVSMRVTGRVVTFAIKSRWEYNAGGHAAEVRVRPRGAWKLILERKAPSES